MSVANTDSTGKIESYLKSSSLKKLILSRLFFRDYSCKVNCEGCCPKFSLDYFEGYRWKKFKRLYPEEAKFFTERTVNGITVYSDMQKDNESKYCRHLDMEKGLCGIHESNPFTCEFELMRFVTTESKSSSILINKLFGRGWNLTRIDGEKGALCEMKDFDYDKLIRDIELLEELNEIGKMWKMYTKLPRVIKYLKDNLPLFKQGNLPKINIVFDDEEEQVNLFTK